MTSSIRARHMTRARYCAAPAGEHTERRFHLTENRRLSSCKAHMSHAKHQLAGGAAYAALDLRDRDEAACVHMAKHEGDRRVAGGLAGPESVTALMPRFFIFGSASF